MKKKRLLYRIMLGFYLTGSLLLTACLLVRYAQNERAEKTAEPAVQSVPEEESEKSAEGTSAKITESLPDTSGEGTGVSQTDPAVIRVCLRSDNYEKELHGHLEITSDASWILYEKTSYASRTDGRREVRKFAKQEIFSIFANDFPAGTQLIAVASGGEPFCFPGLKRDIPKPEYEGSIHLYVEKEGLRIVNEVELETYLKSVVASEMPSSYPLEALKAQAVCARTYAVRAITSQKNKNSFSDLDDSVSFQVYNNQIVSDRSTRAVGETKSEILSLSDALYYSTAYVPGIVYTKEQSDFSDNEIFAASLQALPEEGAEYGSPWVRWNTVLNRSSILTQLEQRSGKSLPSLERIEVSKRSPSGQAEELTLYGDGREIHIDGEYEIRAVLAPQDTPVCLKNGQEISGLTLLPSAWLSVEAYDPESGRLSLCGGGYGHGTGMSQCGAAAMAEDGANYRQILDYYYGESELEHVKNL